MILALLLLLQDSAKIAQEIEYANAKEKPQLHVQAMRRLKDRGGPAVAAEIAAFVSKQGHNALSIAFTEGLGSLKDERITALLRELIRDKDFFWRPTAFRALAELGDAGSRDDFRAALGDRLWGCRAASIGALEKLNDRESASRIKELLGDDVYDVRAQAARTLHAFGDSSGLPVLVEALRANTVWFDIDYGQIAREDAWNFLKKVAKDDFGYKPWETAEERAPGLARAEAWIAKTMPDWRDKVPEKARVRAAAVDYAFGFERRSCQRGDFFFRLDREGNLVLGYFTLEKAKLTDDELKAFNAALDKVRSVDRSLPYGQGGCDFEQYYVRVGDRFEKLWIGLQGRPAGAEPFVRLVVELLRKKFGERTVEEFKQSSDLFRMSE
ncbi:MAG: HEAT repeat domain-containing protein [Planctomycetes bacterium]|nr:HEAT repeat domain-containing protein [Planctomycetota bacterium]